MKTELLNTNETREIKISGFNFKIELVNAIKSGKSISADKRASNNYVQKYNTKIAFVNGENYCEAANIEIIIDSLIDGAYKMFI